MGAEASCRSGYSLGGAWGASWSAERAEPTHRRQCYSVTVQTLLSTGVADRPAQRKEAAMATVSLPQDPDLDQLRRQARELQRAAAPRPGSCASSLLLLVEAGQQAERALEHLRRDEAGGQALVDLQADEQRLPDGPGLDGRGPRGEIIAIGIIGVG